MRFIIVPIEDMKVMFTEQELSTMKKSIDGTKVIVHEEVLNVSTKLLNVLKNLEVENTTMKKTIMMKEIDMLVEDVDLTITTVTVALLAMVVIGTINL